jgi:plasmid stabilization system protein ParE
MNEVTQAYLEGIREGREVFKREGTAYARAYIENLQATIKRFKANSEVGQMLRGELAFWRNQVRKKPIEM